MAVMTYQTLVEQIQVYANRFDDKFISQIPNFIDQGMERIYSQAKNIGFQATTVTFNSADAVNINRNTVSVPTIYLETIAFQIRADDGMGSPTGSYITLVPQEIEYLNTVYSDVTVTGVPKYYALINSSVNAQYNFNILVAPLPNANYHTYHTMLVRFPFNGSPNANVNFLTQKYRRLVLYAALLEAIPFLKDDERIPNIQELYNNALATLLKDKTSRYDDQTIKRDKS